MSESKFSMACKLHNVQVRLMGMEFQDISVDTLLPIIFKECHEENLTFWFSFLENHAILNLRDVGHENYELNIRQYYEPTQIPDLNLDELKKSLLINTFLITNNELNFNEASSKEEVIISSDKRYLNQSARRLKRFRLKALPLLWKRLKIICL